MSDICKKVNFRSIQLLLLLVLEFLHLDGPAYLLPASVPLKCGKNRRSGQDEVQQISNHRSVKRRPYPDYQCLAVRNCDDSISGAPHLQPVSPGVQIAEIYPVVSPGPFPLS